MRQFLSFLTAALSLDIVGITGFYLLKLIFACELTRVSVSKNAAITPLARDLPNCQEYVMTSLVLWIQGVFFLSCSGFFGVSRRLTDFRPKSEDKSGVTETGNRAWKVSGTPSVGASFPLKWAAPMKSNYYILPMLQGWYGLYTTFYLLIVVPLDCLSQLQKVVINCYL